MLAPLSWLRDFAPFPDDADALTAVLDDLGLVVEGVERVGEGLGDVVLARVDAISAIPGADRIRAVTVEAGDGALEIVCGAHNFSVGDVVPLAPVGAVLPGGFEITQRKMKGVVSNGMLCSGRELGLSEDHEGLLILTGVDGALPGRALTEVLGVEPDVVFDVTVEGNRPDAWCMAGVARDLAARLGLPFSFPDRAPAMGAAPGGAVEDLASLVVVDRALCPRMTVRVLTGVTVAPSPSWLARRLLLAGMRPINNVVDASNYVMLELGQPTHPYDLDRLAGGGLLVRRAEPGETVETLDGVVRTLGLPGPGLGDTGEDCVICDAQGTAVGIGGVMGGGSSEIAETTTRVLLEAAYFTPMAIARTSKRLGLRTEASARFERGCDPWAVDAAAERFCALLGLGAVPGTLDVRGDVPTPVVLEVAVARVNAVLGTTLDPPAISQLLEPIGFSCRENGDTITVTAPSFRPDVRPAPHGVDDVIEEVGRTYGYSRLPRRQPSWPQPGGLSAHQRLRRVVREVCCGLGANEAWTATFLNDADHAAVGLTGPAVQVANPLVADEASLRRSLLPGLLRAVAHNTGRRIPSVRLFETGTVFAHPGAGVGRVVERAGAGGRGRAVLPDEREHLAVALVAPGDDARAAVHAWRVLADALRLAQGAVRLEAADDLPGLHPTRSARLVARGEDGRDAITVGAVGEVDPAVATAFGLVEPTQGAVRVGWLDVDLGVLLDAEAVRRRPEVAAPVSRFPSADIDLAVVVPDDVPADRVADALAASGGDLVEAVTLFDVYRGASVGPGQRSLAFHLRFCSQDRTLTDGEVAELRSAAIAAAEALGAVLR